MIKCAEQDQLTSPSEADDESPACGTARDDAECPMCGTTMRLWASFYRCPNCGYKESCCF